MNRLIATCLGAALLMATPSKAEPVFEPVAGYSEDTLFHHLSRPVGKLIIETSEGDATCTGFLIAENHLMTNRHCIAEDRYVLPPDEAVRRQILSISFVLGFTNVAHPSGEAAFDVNIRPVEADESLDYAILQMNGNPARQFGFLRISPAPLVPDMPLWVIGHPQGMPLQVNRTACKVAENEPSLVLHHCETLLGHSGSPVFDATTRDVVALNFARRRDGSRGIARPISTIIASSPFLRALLSEGI